MCTIFFDQVEQLCVTDDGIEVISRNFHFIIAPQSLVFVPSLFLALSRVVADIVNFNEMKIVI